MDGIIIFYSVKFIYNQFYSLSFCSTTVTNPKTSERILSIRLSKLQAREKNLPNDGEVPVSLHESHLTRYITLIKVNFIIFPIERIHLVHYMTQPCLTAAKSNARVEGCPAGARRVAS